MNIENGWVIDEKRNVPKKIGTCDYCGRYVYEDEYYELDGDTLFCNNCIDELKGLL